MSYLLKPEWERHGLLVGLLTLFGFCLTGYLEWLRKSQEYARYKSDLHHIKERIEKVSRTISVSSERQAPNLSGPTFTGIRNRCLPSCLAMVIQRMAGPFHCTCDNQQCQLVVGDSEAQSAGQDSTDVSSVAQQDSRTGCTSDGRAAIDDSEVASYFENAEITHLLIQTLHLKRELRAAKRRVQNLRIAVQLPASHREGLESNAADLQRTNETTRQELYDTKIDLEQARAELSNVKAELSKMDSELEEAKTQIGAWAKRPEEFASSKSLSHAPRQTRSPQDPATCMNCATNFATRDELFKHLQTCKEPCRNCGAVVHDFKEHKRLCKPCNHCSQWAENMKEHKKTCPKWLVVCQFCRNNVSRGDLQAHEQECKIRQKVKTCIHCREAVPDIQIHLETCLKGPKKTCTRCGTTVPKAALGSHLKNDCTAPPTPASVAHAEVK